MRGLVVIDRGLAYLPGVGPVLDTDAGCCCECGYFLKATLCNPSICGGVHSTIYVPGCARCPTGEPVPGMVVRFGQHCYLVEAEPATHYCPPALPGALGCVPLPPGAVLATNISACGPACGQCPPLAGWYPGIPCPCSPGGTIPWVPCEAYQWAVTHGIPCPVFSGDDGQCVRADLSSSTTVLPPGAPIASAVRESCCGCCAGCGGLELMLGSTRLQNSVGPDCAPVCSTDLRPQQCCCDLAVVKRSFSYSFRIDYIIRPGGIYPPGPCYELCEITEIGADCLGRGRRTFSYSNTLPWAPPPISGSEPATWCSCDPWPTDTHCPVVVIDWCGFDAGFRCWRGGSYKTCGMFSGAWDAEQSLDSCSGAGSVCYVHARITMDVSLTGGGNCPGPCEEFGLGPQPTYHGRGVRAATHDEVANFGGRGLPPGCSGCGGDKRRAV